MTKLFIDPEHERDPNAVPDVEVFYLEQDKAGPRTGAARTARIWYWRRDCLPDNDPVGPFASQQQAIDDAQGMLDDEKDEMHTYWSYESDCQISNDD